MIEARKQAFKEHIATPMIERKSMQAGIVPVEQTCHCVQVVSNAYEHLQLPVVRDGFNQLQTDVCAWAHETWRVKILSDFFRERLVDTACVLCNGSGLDDSQKPKYLVYMGAIWTSSGGYRRLVSDRKTAYRLGLEWMDFDAVCSAYGVELIECTPYAHKAHKPDFMGLVMLMPQVAGGAYTIDHSLVYEV